MINCERLQEAKDVTMKNISSFFFVLYIKTVRHQDWVGSKEECGLFMLEVFIVWKCNYMVIFETLKLCNHGSAVIHLLRSSL